MAAPSDNDVVFIHQDFTVTKSMWHGEDLLHDDVSADWLQFCASQLGFAVPDDIELIESQKPRVDDGLSVSSDCVAGSGSSPGDPEATLSAERAGVRP
jgi:hypothetical protein